MRWAMSRTRRIKRRAAMSWRVLSKSGLPVSMQREHRAEAELIGRRLGAAEGRDDLGRSEDQSIVGDGREGDGRVARELLREIEARHANLRRLLLVFDQNDLGPEKAMHDALPVRFVERLRDAHPEVGARPQVCLLLAASVGTVSLDPGGERDALEVLERQHDAGLVGERRIGAEDALASTEATEDLRLPAGALRRHDRVGRPWLAAGCCRYAGRARRPRGCSCRAAR